jgi:hypothetical protein
VRTTAAAIAALLSLAVPSAAQSTGASIGGIVADASGARLPGATLTLTNLANGTVRTFATGVYGEFRATALRPATYRLLARHPGFAAAEREFTLHVGSDATLDIRLDVIGIAETIVVPTAEALDNRARPSSVVSASELRVLPELGRNFLVLAQLLPGSAPLNVSVSRFATTRFGGAADQRSAFTTIVDGGDVDDAQWGTPTINLSQESIQEFRVFRHQFDAQYGHALDAVVSVATRAGGNRLEGSGFYFRRHDRLNARNAFAASPPPFAEQRVGVTAGGPGVRDRLHLFGAFEYDRVRTARIIALPPSNPFATRENGIFPASATERMATARLDHRLSARHTALVRYAHDSQSSIRNNVSPSSDSSQVDTFSRAHSVVAEFDVAGSSRRLNALRVHAFLHTSGGTPHASDGSPGIQRPSVTTGQTVGGDWQRLSRTWLTVNDTVFLARAGHDLKFGGDASFGRNELDAHFFQDGFFVFRSDVAFDPSVAASVPVSFQQQRPGVQTYRARQFALFVQEDWHASARATVSAGLRYDVEPTLRLNAFYAERRTALPGLDAFVGRDRGTDTNNLQPRIAAAYMLRENGTLALRGGWGVYVARNRPWFQLRSMNQLGSPAVLVEDAARLRRYPDIAAILAGGAPLQLGTVISDDFVHAYALTGTAGAQWTFGRGALAVDYVHSSAQHQAGFTDRNLPPTGEITAANPRPVPQFAQVSLLEHFTRSWYDALETAVQMRLPAAGHLQASYTLSRSYMDGVDFFNTVRGTQRTPHERGYSPSDQRHNLAVAASCVLPWRVEAAAVLKLVSGSPMSVQAGFDLDGDRSLTGDRPAGLEITVGRHDVAQSLRLIDAFRAALSPQPMPALNPALLRLDPYRGLDLRLTRSFSRHGRARVDLAIEAFNLTNSVNFLPASVVHNLNSAAFLERRNARDARQLQLGVRLQF